MQSKSTRVAANSSLFEEVPYDPAKSAIQKTPPYRR
jgi:hypothetical protein